MATWPRIRSALGVLVVAAGIVGGAAAAAAQEPSSPIVDTLELDEAAVLAHVAANDPERGGDFGGGEVRTNELFIRFWPDQNVADVFLSLMVVGELEGCPASWSTLNQTTSEPVVVDSSGMATATIAAHWVFERQMPTGGTTCWEKQVVAEWVENVSIDLSFSEDGVSAAVKSETGTPLLAPAVGAAPDNAAVDAAELPAGENVPGEDTASPSDELGDVPGETEAQPPLESGGVTPPTIVLLILMMVLFAFAAWLTTAMAHRFFGTKRRGATAMGNMALKLGHGRDPEYPDPESLPDTPDPPPATTTAAGTTNPVHLAERIGVTTTDDRVEFHDPGAKLWKGEPVGGRTPIFHENGQYIGTIDTAELRRSEVTT